MTSLSAIQAKCAQVDLEIKSRQEEFGVDLYDLLEEYDQVDLEGNTVSAAAFLASFMHQWLQVREEIESYAQKQQGDNNSTRKKKRRWSKASREDSHGEIFVDQWILQRKQQFGVDCFDTAFEVLGTSAGGSSVSTMTPHERKVNTLVQDAVEDVLQLERLKESYAREFR